MPRTPEEQELAKYCLEKALETGEPLARAPFEIVPIADDYFDFITDKAGRENRRVFYSDKPFGEIIR